MTGWNYYEESRYNLDTDKHKLYYSFAYVEDGGIVVEGRSINLYSPNYNLAHLQMSLSMTSSFGKQMSEILRNRAAYYPQGKFPKHINKDITIRTPIGGIETTSKTLSNAAKVGKVCYWGGLIITGTQIGKDISQGKCGRAGVRTGMLLFSLASARIPYVGPFVSIGISVFDVYWGDEYIYDNIDF